MLLTPSTMSSHDDESKTFQDLLEEDLEKCLDYEYDTDFIGSNDSSLVTITVEDNLRRKPNPFRYRMRLTC